MTPSRPIIVSAASRALTIASSTEAVAAQQILNNLIGGIAVEREPGGSVAMARG